MKTEEFHVPFYKSLVFIAIATIVSMISARLFIEYALYPALESSQYTSQKSQISSNP